VSNRTYSQYCGLAHALDLVGERWALLVVRELLLGPKRFTDLAGGLPGIGTNVLSTRLRELEREGLVTRRMLPPPAASVVYELTEYGRELERPLLELGRWGAESLGMRTSGQTLRSGWLGVAMLAFFRPDAERELHATFELDLTDSIFHARVEGDRVAVSDGPATDPDLVLEADNDALVRLLAGALDPAEATAAGAVRLHGDPMLLPRFVEAFRFGLPAA
jgi:DNA-binding HxlR family transcriptional regulator/putative sterol carrier protein